MTTRTGKLLSPTWISSLRSATAVITSVLLVTSQAAAAAADERQPSAAEIVQPVSKSYQELQQALAGPPSKTPLTPDQLAARLDKLFPMLEQAEKQIPRDTFDPQAIIDKVGKDPNKIFEWVRDNTYFVPYLGLLRGDKGVLMDRLGNSLDRAMLLYALLGFVNQPARMVRGTLSEAQANDVLAKVRPFPSFEQRTGSGSTAAAAEEFVKQYAQQGHLDAAHIRNALGELAAQQQRMKELVQKRAAAQAAMIAAMVGPPPANVAAEERAQQVKAITDHWWVQWQNAGKWTDFDPTLPGAQPGQTLTGMHSNVSPRAYTDVGEDLLHTVQIQVVIEIWKQGQVKEVPVLTQQLVPADLIGIPIFLRQIPVHWPQELNLLQEHNPVETFRKTVLAQTEWLPVLSIGSHNVSKYSFDENGELHDSTLPTYVQSVMAGKAVVHAEEQGIGILGQGVAGMLGSHQPSTASKPQNQNQPDRGQVIAEWIEYKISTPTQSPKTMNREIFDLLGPHVRGATRLPSLRMTDELESKRAVGMITETEILPLVCQLSAQFIDELTLKGVLVGHGTLVANFSQARLGSGSQSQHTHEPVPSTLFSFAIARNAWSQTPNAFYLNRTDIVTLHRLYFLGEHNSIKQLEGFDIVDNNVGVAPRTSKQPFLMRIDQGVLDTNVEAITMSHCRADEDLDHCAELKNTSELSRNRGREAVKWNVLTPGDAGRVSSVGLAKHVQLRIERELSEGLVVLVRSDSSPKGSPPTAAWWVINPTSGQTLGIGDRGWGQTATEKFIYTVDVGLFCMAACFAGQDVSKEYYPDVSHDPRVTPVCILTGLVLGIGFAGGAIFSGVTLGALVCIILGSLFGAFLGGFSQ